ncbi:hypothetical protein [Variovorax sp. LG9.2]|uniref:hypothetical protein n=1 Tax=Variovorax sp. LG9.2 TaxID=3048626 RepID=UPI002B223AC6|nr:hypothetical protein [Variovorax sp. LG9.2]MEB0057296.1 hypothetical protein [Variovorax sp. LG9.2]
MKLLTTAIAIALAVGTVQAVEIKYTNDITPTELALIQQCRDAAIANASVDSVISKVTSRREIEKDWDQMVSINDVTQFKKFQALCLFKDGQMYKGSTVASDAIGNAKEGTVRWYQPETKSWVIDKVCYPGMEC